MAKKKTKKTNWKRYLCEGITFLFGIGILVFMALPQISTYLLGVTSAKGNLSGFDLINFSDGANIGVAVVLLLLAIFTSLLLLSIILKFLIDMKIIKNKNVVAVVNALLLLSALATALLTVVNIITIAVYCNQNSTVVEGLINGIVAVWWNIILSAVLGIGALITSALSIKK